MPNFNFSKMIDERDSQRPAGNQQSSGWLKIASGDNRMRILSDAAKYPEHSMYDDNFQEGDYSGICVGLDDGCPGCKTGRLSPSIKYLFWVIDRKDNQIKLAKLTYGVVKSLQTLASDMDWSFDSFPMPYDLNVKYDKSAAPAKKYTVVGSPRRLDVTEAELKEFQGQTPVEEIVQRIKDKKMKEFTDPNNLPPAVAFAQEYPTTPNPDEVPF